MQQVFACIHDCDLHISYLHCKGVDGGGGGGGGGGGARGAQFYPIGMRSVNDGIYFPNGWKHQYTKA